MYESLSVLDSVRLNFSSGGLLFMNIAIGFIMFGVALDIKWKNMKDTFTRPKEVIIGLVAQFVLLPLITFIAVWLLGSFITPGVAFGAILVASCPGGNVSNFITKLARGNTALAVGLTAIGTILAVVMTPLNFELYGKLYMSTSPFNVPIEIELIDVARTVFILLGIPIVLGIFISYKFPHFIEKVKRPINIISMAIFALFVIMAFRNNYAYFVKYISLIFFIVLIHNALAMFSAYWFAKGFRLTQNNCRTITIETGIQNSGLALALIFNPKIFPPDLQIGGMAFIAAWWAIWHIIAGSALAGFWRWKGLK